MPEYILFPQTMLRRPVRGALLPWFKRLGVLIPPGVEEAGVPRPLVDSGLVRALIPSDSQAVEGTELKNLLAKWRDWINLQYREGRLDSIKAGVRTPAKPPESLRNLMKALKGNEPERSDADVPPPDISNGLSLHLAQLSEMQAEEMDRLLSRVEEGDKALGGVMGLDELDHDEAEYQDLRQAPLPPSDPDSPAEKLLPLRLKAWAELARPWLKEEQTVLVAVGLPAAQRLMEQAAHAMGQANEGHSPAGAALIRPEPGAAGTRALPGEAARLVLPDLSALSAEELADLAGKLEQDGGLAEFQSGMDAFFTSLNKETQNPELQAEIGKQADRLSRLAGDMIKARQIKPGRRPARLSIMTLGGFDLAGLISLMKGDTPEPSAKREENLLLPTLW